MSLKDKVAIITGSSKGIGLAIAEKFCEQGAKVVISSRKQDACDVVAAGLASRGYESAGIACHVGDLEQRKSLVDQTIEKYGKIDILVNNAAINPIFGPIEDGDEAAFDKIMNVNVKAVWSLSNLVLPHMIKNGSGSIINISSVEGIHPGFGLGLYSTSKAAVIMLTKNQAKEWGKHNVRSNVICPGLVKTKFSQALWENEKLLGKLERSIPSGRMAQPEEMTGIALLLASDDGSYMTGGVYTADGGYLIAG
ncbi:SDR family NAD(P)-dependent oxidoreductase [Portibacter lacus]|uniref:Dehydrogenase n=1 Tax=Portibacter lacus TaxID=1099794 RepID=A0AA37SW11_9BACT|nr:glucose 1-dehydrogenase [Portibacter lacus]GLR18755.1 dehydrogenase [Portibacter lacus]